MAMTFKVEPRHVQMFGAQGILAPLYQRQATKMALTEQQRQEQSRFEQMKALTELRARLQQQFQGPLQQAQIGAAGARQEFSEFQLGQAEGLEELFGQYGAATTEEERRSVLQEIGVRQGWYRPEGGQQFAPPKPTFMIDPETGMPIKDEQGRPISVPGTAKFLPTGRGSQVSRLNLADRTLKGMRARYNRDSKPSVRFDYSDIDWDSRPMRSLGIERAGILGIGKGVIGGGRVEWMDNIMSVMATPATVADSTGQIVPDRTEYSRRANIIQNFRTELEDEPKSASKEKMRQLLHDMERAFNESIELSSEEGQIFLSQPTQMMPQQRIVGEEVPEGPWGTWGGP